MPNPWATRLLLLSLFTAFPIAACKKEPPGHPSGTGGQGGSGGSCPDGPNPMLILSLSAVDGAVPSDTTITVTWSAGSEPVFVLSDSKTWKTLEDANLVCRVDRQNPPSADLMTLVCDLWTSGPTEVKVEATGYAPFAETFAPAQSERCGGPIPTPIAVVLMRPADAGANP